MVVRNNNKLECSSEEYAELHLATEELYENYDPFTFISLSPCETWKDALSSLNFENALGVKDEEYRLPMSLEQWKVMTESARELPAYKELISDSDLISAFNKYLKSYGIDSDSTHYELFIFRLLNFVSGLFSEFIEQSEKSIEELLLRDKDREKLMGYVTEFRKSVHKLAFDNGDDRAKFNRLLKRVRRLNSAKSIFAKPPVYKNTAEPKTDHALRQLGMKLVIFFKTVNKKSHTSLVRQILRKSVPTVSKNAVGGYVTDAKEQMAVTNAWDTHFLTDTEVQEIKDLSSGSSFSKYRAAVDKYKKENIRRLNSADSNK